METSRNNKLPAAALFLLLLVIASEMAAPVQAKECLKRTRGFRGLCVRSRRCANACRKDGFAGGGKCSGFIRRCYCRTPCAAAA
ncbi:unnamed protein product [Urochloa decumbens]|uniref:Knottins-like domain-containing protein n=1 Tax=Urochloa decumbens TaxID=240449 RepID=A0ABC8YCX5_9POAL